MCAEVFEDELGSAMPAETALQVRRGACCSVNCLFPRSLSSYTSAHIAPERTLPVPYAVQEWLNIALRWTHVFAAIMWVGQTYFFTWLDHTFHHERQVWMVHSGGFYVVDKQKEPKRLDQTLPWFQGEAAFTWISGF